MQVTSGEQRTMMWLGHNKGVLMALAGILLAVLLSVPARPAQAALGPLSVSGNTLLMGGQPGRFIGVNRSGTEYACIQGWDIFDGPSDAASVQAMASWHVNAVRVPLNEDCWLGINGAPAQYSGSNYINAIVNYVNLLHQYGMYAELSLIWAAPGAYQATYQSGAPDADHSPAMWAGMASVFKNDPNVVLAPWGETIVDWTCFRDGGTCEATYGPKDTPYQTAGMQQAVDVMRQNGYRGVISIPCIDYANDCSDDNGSWLDYAPKDSLNQLVAEAHVYGKNTCDTAACFNNTMGPLLQRVPLLFGETGETYDDSDCGSSYIQTFMSWADAHNVGYQAWTWDTWGTCDSLIGSYSGTPYAGYGTWVRSHYNALAGASPTATPTATGTALTSTPTNTATATRTPTASKTPAGPTATATGTSTAPTATPTVQAGGGQSLVMYQNAVAPGFTANAFAYTSKNACNASTYVSPPCSYSIAYTGWGGISFAPVSGSINPARYSSLDYNLNPSGQPIDDLSVLLLDPAGNLISETELSSSLVQQTLPGGWVHVSIPMSTMGAVGTNIGWIQLKNWLSSNIATVYYDDIQLVAPGGTASPTPTSSQTATPTRTAVASSTSTATTSPTATSSPTQLASATPTATATSQSTSPTATATATATATPTSKTNSPTATQTTMASPTAPAPTPTRPAGPPAAPGALSASLGQTAQITLSWRASSTPNVTYNVYRGSGIGTEQLLVSGVAGTTYVDASITPRAVYWYYVTAATSGGGESGKSNETVGLAF